LHVPGEIVSPFVLPLVGPGGERVDLLRTLVSHGIATLPPMFVDEEAVTLETTVALPNGRPVTVIVRPGSPGEAEVEVLGRTPGVRNAQAILDAVGHMLRLDEDLSPFYDVCRLDPEMGWVCTGAGRMLRSSSVFEEVVKTVCTTNCAWSATVRMVSALVEHLGEAARSAPSDGVRGRAFPTPEAMAGAEDEFYKQVVRAGYRGPYLRSLARSVSNGELDLEYLVSASPEELPDDALEKQLLALPGVGPYAAAHVMMMLGRYSRLILDSWTRPTYARIAGYKKVKDTTIVRRWRRYGPYAGLAFWLYITKSWVAEEG
jgi:3-methyladenine DNA glycosylase/8-oxoguanine DNA glycosylase